MRLAIIGSRTFCDYDLLKNWVSIYITNSWGSNVKIISGGAKGADTLGECFADDLNFEKEIYLADWNKEGKAAGFMRNQQIVDACDIVVAFWDGKSRGTKDTIDKARIARKPTFIVYV